MLTVLDDDMKRVVREQRLGYVATVCPDGTPNLSPKGTTAVWDDEHLVFLDLFSPGTVANIEAGQHGGRGQRRGPDPAEGLPVQGPGRGASTDGPVFEDVVHWYETERGSDVSRVNSVVLVQVERVAPLVSPAYADGSSEATIEQRSLDMYGLKRRTP